MYGIKLRQLRRQLGLTQRQLGTLCGVGGTTISMIEHGKRLPGRETLRRLQVVLGDLPPRPAKPLPTAELLTLLRGDENNSARGVGTQHQYLAHKIRDLPGREVDHPQHLYARQVLRAVVVGDLRRGLFYPDLRAEIHRELVGRAAGLGKRLRRQDGAHPDIQPGKIFECRQLFFHQMLISLATL